jgi:hypothetical protein
MITMAEVLAQMHQASSMLLCCGTTDEIKSNFQFQNLTSMNSL